MNLVPFHTRWVRRKSFSIPSFTVGKTYKVEEWIHVGLIKAKSNTGSYEKTDPRFWEVDEYMENLERHILN